MTRAKQIPKKRNGAKVGEIALSISVDLQLRDAIETIAKREDRSMSYTVRKAVEQYLRLQAAPEDLRKAIDQFLGIAAAA